MMDEGEMETASVLLHIKDDMSVCDVCKQDYKTNHDLRIHQKVAHGLSKDFKCTKCRFTTDSEKDLQMHLEKHSKGCKYQCDMCNHIFSSGFSLRRHVQYKHTHEKPWPCPHCRFAAVEEHKLTLHMMHHIGVQPYQCNICQKKFRSTTELRMHESTHTRERDFICILCFQLFRLRNLLKQHMLAAHCVHDNHIMRLTSIKKFGMPETLLEYIKNSLCLEEKTVMEGKEFLKFYILKDEYTKCYSTHFKNVSPIITAMERKRDGVTVTDTVELRGIHKRLFLGDHHVTKELLSQMDRKSKRKKVKQPEKANKNEELKNEDYNAIASLDTETFSDITNIPGKVCETPVTNMEVVTPVTNMEVVTPVTNMEVVTPVANMEVVTPVTTMEVVTPVKNMEVVTPVTNMEVVTPVTNMEVVTPVTNMEVVTPVTNMEVVTPVTTMEVVAFVEINTEKAVHVTPEEIIEIDTEKAANSTVKVGIPKEKKIPRLVREDEDKEKRTMLLDKMKTGGFGSKPHVIRILPGGIIVDCTENYKQYLPS